MELKVKKLYQNSKVPTRGSEYAAGYDLYARKLADYEDQLWIQPHTTAKIGTGIAVKVPHGYFGAVFARSGLATKKGLRPANAVGVVDEDYTGEIFVAMHNDTNSAQCVDYGDRIAQLVIIPYQAVDFVEVDELDETERGSGGFGSTGSK